MICLWQWFIYDKIYHATYMSLTYCILYFTAVDFNCMYYFLWLVFCLNFFSFANVDSYFYCIVPSNRPCMFHCCSFVYVDFDCVYSSLISILIHCCSFIYVDCVYCSHWLLLFDLLCVFLSVDCIFCIVPSNSYFMYCW